MKLSFILYSFFFFLCSTTIFSQTKSTKTVVNLRTKLPIENVYINSNDGKLNLTSNKNGELIIISDAKTRSFSFYKIGYVKQLISLDNLVNIDTIFLAENSINLQEVVITSKTLETVIEDKRYYVNDYLILPNNDFIILTSKINTKGFEIAYYKTDKGITCRKKIPNEGGEHLFQDCFKNIHLVTNNFSRQLLFESDSTFDFIYKYTKAKFDSTAALCVLKTDTQLVLKSSAPATTTNMQYVNYKMNSPFLSYILESKQNRTNLYTIYYNKHLQEMMNNEVNDVKNFQRTVNEDVKSRYSHTVTEQSVEADIAFFYTKIAKPIYAPIFLKNDTIVVFNFQEKIIALFNKQGKELTQIQMNEKDFSTLREFEIIYDCMAKKFYLKTTEFDKQTLNLININSGTIIRKKHLEKMFAKNIQVYNDKIYYLFKEKDWNDTSYLYQQNF